MTAHETDPKNSWDVVPWTAAVVGCGALLAADPRSAAMLVAIWIVALAWRWPAAMLQLGVFTVLSVRPSLDIFSERRLGLGPFTSSPSVLFGAGILLLAAVLGVRRAKDGLRVWPDRLLLTTHAWLGFALGVAFVSGVVFYRAQGLVTGFREAVRVSSIIAAFLLVLWWADQDRKKYDQGWAFLVLGLVVPVGVAIWQLVSGQGNREIEGLNRLQGTFSHPNTFGPFLVPFIAVTLWQAQTSRGLSRLSSVIGAALLTLLLAMTYSRTAMLVLAAAIVCLPFLQRGSLRWRGIARGAVIIVLFLGLTWIVAGDLIRERFSDLLLGSQSLEALTSGSEGTSLSWRLTNWAVLVALGMAHPLVGHGAGMTIVLNPMINGRTGLPYNAHNDFVRVFFEGGALGLVSYVVYGVLLCKWALQKARHAPVHQAPRSNAVVASLLAMLFLTGGATEFGLQTAILCELYGMLALFNAMDSSWE